MLAHGMYQRRWLRGLLVATLVLLFMSGCGGSGQQEKQEEGQASQDALDAALKQSFRESGASGVIAAVQTPDYTWVRALGVASLNLLGEPSP